MSRKIGFGVNKARELMCRKDLKIHFIGVGGVSMCSLASLSLKSGFSVSGSDREESDRTRLLSSLGATVTVGHSSGAVNGADCVVYSHAISQKNPEYMAAENLGIPMFSRAEYLGALMLDYSSRIGVMGTHGKSTTTAMLDHIFLRAGTDHTTLLGAELPTGEPYRIGGRELLIYESCEYKDSFLQFSPTVALALNLEYDHADYFPDINSLCRSFTSAISRASALAIINLDDENLREISEDIKIPTVTFGQCESADYTYRVTSFSSDKTVVELRHFGTLLDSFTLKVMGMHNVTDAVAAIVTALEYGVSKETIKSAMADFAPIKRRMEHVGYRGARAIYYDYAHHPTEIAATVNTLRLKESSPVTVVFKPHTYSRTKALWDLFCAALTLADHVIVTDIYPARESPIANVSSERLAEAIGDRAIFCADADVPRAVDNFTHGIIIVMGAGDLEAVKNSLISYK